MSDQPNPPPVPVKLELAKLPREQVGPFFLLGADKTASQEEIEANWAKRVILARKKQIDTPLEDINWAREFINEKEKRVLADAAGLNADTTPGFLKQLERDYAQAGGVGCGPIDDEKDLSAFSPDIEIPDPEEIRKSIPIPDIPMEFPLIQKILEELADEPIDPWKLDLPSEQ